MFVSVLDKNLLGIVFQFLNVKKWYALCKIYRVKLNFVQYFKDCEYPFIDDLCSSSDDFHDLIVFLCSIGQEFTFEAIDYASRYGHLRTIKHLHLNSKVWLDKYHRSFSWYCELHGCSNAAACQDQVFCSQEAIKDACTFGH